MTLWPVTIPRCSISWEDSGGTGYARRVEKLIVGHRSWLLGHGFAECFLIRRNELASFL